MGKGDVAFNDVFHVLDLLSRQRHSEKLSMMHLLTITQELSGITNNEQYLTEFETLSKNVEWPHTRENFFYIKISTTMASDQLHQYLTYPNHPGYFIPAPDHMKQDVVAYHANQENLLAISCHLQQPAARMNAISGSYKSNQRVAAP